jgi:aspartate/methionine/tyrosine aminotransferase
VAACDDVLSFALSGLSKVAGLPQLKLGWCVAAGPGSAEALRKLELIADTYLSVSTPVQIAARELLATRHAFQRALLDRVARNRAALLAARGSDAPWDALPAEGGWSAILSVPRSRSEEEWALAALDQGALVHPGYFFDFPEGAHLVLSLLPEPAQFDGGVAALVRALG